MEIIFLFNGEDYLRENFHSMSKASRNMYWLLFFASLVLAVLVYLFIPALTSITLVPILTTFTKALDLI
jgi:Na+-driven multidrug efflux pump